MSTPLALVIGIIISYFLGRGFSSRLSPPLRRAGSGQAPKIIKVIEQRKSEKDTRKERIIQYLKEHKEITNDKVEELLGVGNTAAYNR
ncbi:MAG: hypothetical protein HY473_02630 [Candidatus Sungbacteria bacterium]|uniref:Helix-turn-helix type 11 domain-containing protein n=1 Tax=Candidatus Sungiibacteriota bacterium TaxID=2750080 RepID=A0A933DS90_9BACT|nr:hypothetical protein [Candidatus Sungbacteria bacterium]